jgi:thiamine biosynthesis lipoprotein
VRIKTYPSIIALCLLLVSTLTHFSCNTTQKHEGRFFAFDTVIDVTIYSGSAHSKAAIDSLEKIFASIESTFSISRPNGELCRINNRYDSLVVISDTLRNILAVCKDECERSGGLFDVTVEPLKYIYGLESHQTANHVPSRQQLDSVMALIGFARIRFLSDSTFIMPAGMHLDFGGIAKGYALVAAQRYLLAKGYRSFLINTGGDLIAHGTKPSAAPWTIGIQNPRNKASLIATLPVVDKCVFTSGDYERFFIQNGRRYHHLFDPTTGLPGSHNMSATVLGTDPLVIDAVVKTVFLMPAEKGLEYLNGRNLAGLIIDSTGAGWATLSMQPLLRPDSAFAITYR